MKKYIKPSIKDITIKVEDIILTSYGEIDPNKAQLHDEFGDFYKGNL